MRTAHAGDYAVDPGLGRPAFGTPGGAEGVSQLALAGTTVAYQKLMIPGEGEVGNAVWLVYVRDLRNGRVVRKLPTGAAPPGAHAVGVGRVLKMVVQADGGVAWTVEDRFGPPGVHFYQVRAVDKTGNRLAGVRRRSPAGIAHASGQRSVLDAGWPVVLEHAELTKALTQLRF